MPLLASLEGAAASGSYSFDCRGVPSARVYVKPTDGALTGVAVSVGPDSTHQAALDASALNTIASGVTKQLFVAGPVDVLVVAPTADDATEVDILITDPLMP